MKFSLCIEPILPDMDFYDRVRLAADVGYDAIEFWSPGARDLDRLASLAARCGLEIAACCAHNHRRDHLASDCAAGRIAESVRVLGGFGVRQVILMSGDVNCRRDSQKLLIAENLKRLRDAAERQQVRLLLEPLNTIVDHKGYYLDSAQVAFELVRIADSPWVQVLYDIYHMQVMEGNILSTLEQNLGRIGHIHLAGVPGRHEPSGGELNMGRVLSHLNALGYGRYAGMEYWPVLGAPKGLRDELARMKEGARHAQ